MPIIKNFPPLNPRGELAQTPLSRGVRGCVLILVNNSYLIIFSRYVIIRFLGLNRKAVDVKMRFHALALSLILCFFIVGCGDNSDENNPIYQNGDIFGTVTDKETGMPLKSANIQIGTKTALTDDNGKYSIKEIALSDNIDVTITASDYNDYRGSISLQQELLVLDIAMVPSQSHSTPILAVLDAISRDIESLDDSKIPNIQSYFSEDYVAGDDAATAAGIFAGVVPPNYDAIPDTIRTINKKYSKLAFKFTNPDVKFGVNSADVQMRFVINAETNPPDPKIWEIVIDGKMTFVELNGKWKMTFWGLIPPFIKFEQNPLN
jgi:hypothetical protein